MSKPKFSISSSQFGLGDVLLLTNICAKFPGQMMVQLPPQYERFSILFKGLAEVDIAPLDKCWPLNEYGDGHYTRRKLRSVIGSQAEYTDIRPVVLYEDPESNFWAAEYLKDKPNPVIVCPFVAAKWSQVRDLPYDTLQEIFGAAKYKGKTPIIIQSDSDHQWDHPTLNNLELPRLICLMRQAGEYWGANTGLYHLAAAVGAKITCYQPENSPYFNPEEWCYQHPTIEHKTWIV